MAGDAQAAEVVGVQAHGAPLVEDQASPQATPADLSTDHLWTGAGGPRRLHAADMTPMKIFPAEIRRPDLLLHEVCEQQPFDRPKTLLACVDGRDDQQRLVDVTVLWEEPAQDERERTLLTEQALRRLGFGVSRRPYPQWPIAVPVVIRPGSAWWSWDEREVWLGLRYGSNLCDVLQGDVLTVTACGWVSHLDELHGREPRAAWTGLTVPRAEAAS